MKSASGTQCREFSISRYSCIESLRITPLKVYVRSEDNTNASHVGEPYATACLLPISYTNHWLIEHAGFIPLSHHSSREVGRMCQVLLHLFLIGKRHLHFFSVIFYCYGIPLFRQERYGIIL